MEVHRLSVFENKGGHNITGGWRKLLLSIRGCDVQVMKDG
jgi:hypothetical protein